ncbi:MAG: alpha-amylase family glycosyl hydrolase [Candidatus Ozemobacteraceae bacterium]
MRSTPLFASPFSDAPSHGFIPLSPARQGKVYVDIPHRFFPDIPALKRYVKRVRDLGANVLLLLPHFLPSFSEYVVKNFEQPAPLFGTWEVFADFMKYVKELGMDRMIDIPFNHADWQAENLERSWYKNHESKGIEAGADDVDADGKRVRINWGAYILDNANPALQRYWLDKVIFPHVESYHVNAIRIDAAWGLDRNGLATLIRETKAKAPHVWFLAENLGMAPLIELAESGINAGAERFFNNYYWHSGGRGVPADTFKFFTRGKGRPSCTIYGNHDVLMPAMRALARLQAAHLTGLNDKGVHRQIVELDGIHGPKDISELEREDVLRLMKIEFALAALLSTDLMTGAGVERMLIERVDVLRSGPDHFAKGIDCDFSSFMSDMIRARQSDPLFCGEGVIMPFGAWEGTARGVKGYVKRVGRRFLLVAGNTDLKQVHNFRIPRRFIEAGGISQLTTTGTRPGHGKLLPEELSLGPGQILILFTPA